MKKKTVLPISRGEFRAIAVTSLIICLSVVLPPHLVPLLQPLNPPLVEITDLSGVSPVSGDDQPMASKSGYTEILDSHRVGASRDDKKGHSRSTRNTFSSGNQQSVSKRTYGNDNTSRMISKARCVAFDPNTVPGDTLLEWGWRPYVVRNMVNYRSSGGKFRKAKDVARIYGMDSSTYTRIVHCIVIEKEIVRPVYVNTADTTQWMALPGIGRILSKRIIKFRDKLGGFYNVAQVGSTYGLSEETFRGIRPYLRMRSEPRTIDLTTATEAQLAAHPYISEKQARVMINYFDQHGRPQSLDDLSNLYIADSIWLARTTPYFTILAASVN